MDCRKKEKKAFPIIIVKVPWNTWVSVDRTVAAGSSKLQSLPREASKQDFTNVSCMFCKDSAFSCP